MEKKDGHANTFNETIYITFRDGFCLRIQSNIGGVEGRGFKS